MSETSNPAPVRVVLVDDHAMFRSGVRGELATVPASVVVVGEAGDVDEAVRVIDAERPDVVLLDVHLPGGGGVSVVKRAVSPDTRRCMAPGRLTPDAISPSTVSDHLQPTMSSTIACTVRDRTGFIFALTSTR